MHAGRGSQASFAGYLLEGDFAMSSIPKKNKSLMASAGRILLSGVLAVCPVANMAATGSDSPQNVLDPTQLSLEDLMNLRSRPSPRERKK